MAQIQSINSMMNRQAERPSVPENNKVTSQSSSSASSFSQNNESMNEKILMKEPSQEEIKNAMDELNKKMVNAEAVFGVHEETGRQTVKLVDKETQKVIKEFPSEKMLDMLAKVWKMSGIIVDEKR